MRSFISITWRRTIFSFVSNQKRPFPLGPWTHPLLCSWGGFWFGFFHKLLPCISLHFQHKNADRRFCRVLFVRCGVSFSLLPAPVDSIFVHYLTSFIVFASWFFSRHPHRATRSSAPSKGRRSLGYVHQCVSTVTSQFSSDFGQYYRYKVREIRSVRHVGCFSVCGFPCIWSRPIRLWNLTFTSAFRHLLFALGITFGSVYPYMMKSCFSVGENFLNSPTIVYLNVTLKHLKN